jgi:hypothetical protein
VPPETPRWGITWRPASIPPVVLHIALRSLCHCFFLLCRSPILKEHSNIVPSCDNASERVRSVCACIGIAMQWVTWQKSLLSFFLLVRKMHFSLYYLYKSFQVAKFMLQSTFRCSFRLSPVLLLVAVSGLLCVQPTMFPTLKTCKTTPAGALLTCTNLETGSQLPKFSGIVVSARANQYSMKAPSSFWS